MITPPFYTIAYYQNLSKDLDYTLRLSITK